MPYNEPNSKDVSNTGSISMNMSNFLSKLKGLIQNDDTDRATWKAKMIVAQNQRLGVKRYTEYPYPGAPDIPLPETDKLIKKQVPNLVLSAWAPKNLCVVDIAAGYEEKPDWKEKAKKVQMVLNSLLRSRKMDWFKKLYLAADYKKTYGHCLFRVREEFKCNYITEIIDLDTLDKETAETVKSMNKEELRNLLADRYSLDLEDEGDLASIDEAIAQFKSGERQIEVQIEKIESFPNVDVPLPTKVLVPNYTTDVTQAQRITYEYFISRQELETRMRDGIYRKKDLETLQITTQDDDMVEKQKMYNEGVSDNAASLGEMFRIHETLTWYREKESDPLTRWVFVTLADVGDPEKSLLQDNDFPYGFDEWNYDKCDEEIKDPRYFNSRGVPEQNRAYQEVMERAVNNILIRDEMVNTPMWEVLNTSELMDDHITFMPGRKLPVKQIGTEIGQIGSQSIPDMASANILQMIKAYVEEYQSSNDYLFKNATNKGGGNTLGEVNLGIRQNAQPLQLEVISWNETLSKVYQKMFLILKDRLGESMFIKGVEITREDFNFPAEVRSNGDLEVADQVLQAQKSMGRLQVLLNPALQDVVNSEDRFNILTDWLEKDGVKDPTNFITNPLEIAQGQIAEAQKQLQELQGQMAGMQKESQAMMQQSQSAKREAEKSNADAKEADEYSQKVDMGIVTKIGKDIGSQMNEPEGVPIV